MKRLGIALATVTAMNFGAYAAPIEMTFEEFREQCRKPALDIYTFCGGYIVGMISQMVSDEKHKCPNVAYLQSVIFIDPKVVDSIVMSVALADIYSNPKDARLAVNDIINMKVCGK